MRISVSHPRSPRRTARRGFTLVEMCLAMLVTSMVFGALAGFALAISNMWKYSDDTQRAVLASNQAALRVQDVFQGAKGTGYYTTGAEGVPACLVIWGHDGDTSRGVAADGRAQKSELQLLRFNETDKALEIYRQPTPAGTDQDMTTLIDDPGLPEFLSTGVTPQPIARGVSNGRFMVNNPRSTTSSPALVFQFVAEAGDTGVRQNGSVAMHAPGTLP